MSRPSLKESIGTAVNASNLASDVRKEGDADRIAALARTNALGAVLWRLKVGGDMTVLKRAAILLAHRAEASGNTYSARSVLIIKVCQRVISEWLQDKCAKCMGLGRVGMGKGTVISTSIDCATCGGGGRVQHIGPLSAWHLQELEYGPLSTEARKHILATTKPCDSCDGIGKVELDKTVKKASLGKPCNHCLGTGRRRVNNAERARIVGIRVKNYWKTWHTRFRDLHRLVAESDGVAVEEARTALRGPRDDKEM